MKGALLLAMNSSSLSFAFEAAVQWTQQWTNISEVLDFSDEDRVEEQHEKIQKTSCGLLSELDWPSLSSAFVDVPLQWTQIAQTLDISDEEQEEGEQHIEYTCGGPVTDAGNNVCQHCGAQYWPFQHRAEGDPNSCSTCNNSSALVSGTLDEADGSAFCSGLSTLEHTFHGKQPQRHRERDFDVSHPMSVASAQETNPASEQQMDSRRSMRGAVEEARRDDKYARCVLALQTRLGRLRRRLMCLKGRRRLRRRLMQAKFSLALSSTGEMSRSTLPFHLLDSR